MFDQLKQIGKIKEMQKSLEKEMVEVEKNGLKVVLDGNLKIVSINLNDNLKKQEQEELLKNCINEAMDKLKFSMAKKFQSML